MVETATPVLAEKENALQDIPYDQMPDHTQLPDEDGTFVKNFQEHPQSMILTESLSPILEKLHPDGKFAIGQDSGIYWRLADPPEKGAVAPDWYYVPGVTQLLNGVARRSYVLWQEYVPPFIVIEFVSETNGGEYDRTPMLGKFWVYERVIRPAFYAVFNAKDGLLDLFHLVEDSFRPIAPNQRRHFPIPQLGVELGIWRGEYRKSKLPWLRVWDTEGNLLPTDSERADQADQRAEEERQRADREAAENTKLKAKLRELGINPEEITT